tara:strand:- start:205 stop:354 length:150 start_codon:yes stop_codon:yes gene_type:complete
MEEKDIYVRIKISSKSDEKLKSIAKRLGISKGEAIRMIIENKTNRDERS